MLSRLDPGLPGKPLTDDQAPAAAQLTGAVAAGRYSDGGTARGGYERVSISAMSAATSRSAASVTGAS